MWPSLLCSCVIWDQFQTLLPNPKWFKTTLFKIAEYHIIYLLISHIEHEKILAGIHTYLENGPNYIYLKIATFICRVLTVVQLLSHIQLFVTPWTAQCQAPMSSTVSQSLLTLMPIESVMPSNHLILCHPLLLLPFSLSHSIRVFSSESILCIRWPKYWSFSFSISPSNEYSGLISFRVDWFDLLAVQGTLKSLLPNHSFKSVMCLLNYLKINDNSCIHLFILLNKSL